LTFAVDRNRGGLQGPPLPADLTAMISMSMSIQCSIAPARWRKVLPRVLVQCFGMP
jgi:hypothetical protein